MDKFTDHSIKMNISRFFDYIDMKCIVATLSVELGMFLVAVYKGQGRAYLPIVLLLMGFTVVGCIISTCAGADKKILVIIIVLLNLGFLVQQIQSRESQTGDAVTKLAVALGTALFMAFIYSKISRLLSKDVMIIIMMIVQLAVSFAVFFLGQVIGADGSQGATISINGITPFEFVKIMYLFIAVGLLCSENDKIRIIKWSVDRELILIVHTAFLSLTFILCNELGTLLIVYITGLVMFYMFGSRRKWIKVLGTVSVGVFIIVWFVCDRFLFPLMLKNAGTFPSVIGKLIRRFGVALHPEFYINDYGYQGARGLMAIAIGGWLGIGTERHRISLPEANNDFIFANVIETCGILFGFVLIIFILAFFKQSMVIAERCEKPYFKGIASGVGVVIVVESIIHIGYNMALLPITGIPLYFLSQGFSAIITSMCLVAILLVISVDNRNEEVEE